MLWRKIQKNNFRDIKKLAHFLELDPEKLSHHPRFPLNVPMRLAEKMRKGNLSDPLFRQFVPLPEENLISSNYVEDPVNDKSFCKTSKLLQKYEGRALILTTSACAMHCRFCFRQNFDYASKNMFEKELQLIKEDPSLKEIILSGGDPLSLSDLDLKTLLDALALIPHVKIIRFHTRFPIGIPERIDASFIQTLKECQKQIVFLVHVDHPLELDSDVLTALKQLQALGIPLLMQTVLLKGVNDDFSVLHELFFLAVSHGIIPYYLHQLDKVKGASHFEVDEIVGHSLMKKLSGSLPGYAVPRYVREIPGNPSKTLLSSSFAKN